ncbi:MAG: cytochrome c biogenesis protein CcsA [Dehalococcoidia bacterium]|nr:cytochrome c biogenesis protein CcsA [Dehalococcoidia bacterium]
MIGRLAGGAFLPLVAALMVLDLYLIFIHAPVATADHRFNLQRILYFHVGIAWVSLIAFAVIFVASLVYLWRRDSRWDALAHSAAEVGFVFASLVLITGSLWGKGIWDRWWTWEPRLTTMLILWLIYVAYLMLRSFASNPNQAARFSAVLGIIGFIDVPIIYFAANWWRGLHPEVVSGPLADTGSLDPTMRWVMLFTALVFTLLFSYLVKERMSVRSMEDTLRRAKYTLGAGLGRRRL